MVKLFLCLLPFICLVAIPVVGFNYGAQYWVYGISLSLLLSLFVSIIVEHIAEFVGDVSSKLFISGSAHWTLYEQLAGPLNHVRFLISEHRFSEAFIQLEKIITRTPNHAEALLLKARILWEGFRNVNEAKLMLSQVIKITPEDDPNHLLAESFYRDIIKAS